MRQPHFCLIVLSCCVQVAGQKHEGHDTTLEIVTEWTNGIAHTNVCLCLSLLQV